MKAADRVYWLDSNVLISAKDGPFRFAVAPVFWKVLDEQVDLGTICIPKPVYDEIVKDGPSDELAQRLKNRRNKGFCVFPDRQVQEAYRKVADHVQANYESPFAAEFLSVADPWVIAYAMEGKGVVVTFESRSPGAKRVKIPNVCAALNVRFMNLYDMLQALGISFA
jgi:hypothetical protein